MKKFSFLILLLLNVIAFKIQAQLRGQARIDSLIAAIPGTNDDTNKVKLLVEISFTFYSINPDEGIRYGNQALLLAEQL